MPPSDSLSKTTLILETGVNPDFLVSKLKQVFADDTPLPSKIVLASPPGQREKILLRLSLFLKKFEVVEVQSLRHDLLPHVTTPFLAYLPANAPYSPPTLEGLERWGPDHFFIRPWIPPVTLKDTEWARLVYMAFGWISTPALFQHLGMESTLTLLDLERVSKNSGGSLPYFSAPAGPSTNGQMGLFEGSPKLSPKSRVLALVPHFNCEQWLGQCLDSLIGQTRPPNAIAVLDDASTKAPLDIAKKYPTVTLLRSPENVGPYRLLQTVIDQTGFDAYMFQDADDWSSLDRLEELLNEAERTGAEWIGTQELMYFEDIIHACRYPLDLNSTPQASIRHPFCYPGSVISRDFLMRLGGFASGLRFSGDFELLTRAVWAGKVRNLDRYTYFRRIRKNSLITSEGTGLSSPARKEVDTQIEARKAENLARVIKGGVPNLEPLKTVGPVAFEHLAGPPLK
jgi:hypothetical protein